MLLIWAFSLEFSISLIAFSLDRTVCRLMYSRELFLDSACTRRGGCIVLVYDDSTFIRSTLAHSLPIWNGVLSVLHCASIWIVNNLGCETQMPNKKWTEVIGSIIGLINQFLMLGFGIFRRWKTDRITDKKKDIPLPIGFGSVQTADPYPESILSFDFIAI